MTFIAFKKAKLVLTIKFRLDEELELYINHLSFSIFKIMLSEEQ